jgi:cation:H+ antiporter
MLDFASLSLIVTIPLFLAAAVVVWIAGVKITRYANVISDRTGLGHALVGLLLLGGVTSLPELAVAVSASMAGDSALAVNSILGGIAMQVAILAVADAVLGSRALTHVVPDPTVILQAGLKVLLLSIVAAAIMIGDVPVLRTGVWMWLLAAVTGVAMFILSRVQEDQPWIPRGEDISKAAERERADKEAQKDEEKSLRWAIWRAAIAAIVIVAAGYVLSRTGDAIAEQTGLGQSFVGAVFVAIATSLPELSTVVTAMRAGLYTMAMSDIFGTNLFDVSFLFIVDMVGDDKAVMNEVGPFSGFAALIAITVTAIFIVGLAERRNRTFLRMGYDSLAVLVVYLCGLVVLYFLREGGGG